MAGAPGVGPRKPQPSGPFVPGARLDASQVYDERGHGGPMKWVHFEDGSTGWITDPHPGGFGSSHSMGVGNNRGAPGGGRVQPPGDARSLEALLRGLALRSQRRV